MHFPFKKSGSQNLLKSLAAQDVNTSEVTAFILQIVYNRTKKEKTPGESRYNMLLTRKAKSKTYPSSKCIPPDQKSLNMKILRANYVTHCMVHCLVNDYIPLDPSEYGWKSENGSWSPVWYEGNALPDVREIASSDDDDENDNDDVHDTNEDESSDDSEFDSSGDSSDEDWTP